MNATAVSASLFAPALRRRISFASSIATSCRTPQRLTNEDPCEMAKAKAFSRINNGYQMPFSKFPGPGFSF